MEYCLLCLVQTHDIHLLSDAHIEGDITNMMVKKPISDFLRNKNIKIVSSIIRYSQFTIHNGYNTI